MPLEGRRVPGRWKLVELLSRRGRDHAWLFPLERRSYSQHGDDRLLAELLHGHAPASFLDVGCHHPRNGSDTYLLYRLGWRGTGVDGDPQWARPWRRTRPGDRFVQAIVSPEGRPATLHLQGATSSISRVPRTAGPSVAGPSVTLGALLEASGLPHDLGLLKLDLEGIDLDVLAGLDTVRWRPCAILVETHHMTTRQAVDDERLQGWCRRAGYEVVAHNRRNVVLAEKAWLARRFNGLAQTYAELNPATYRDQERAERVRPSSNAGGR